MLDKFGLTRPKRNNQRSAGEKPDTLTVMMVSSAGTVFGQ
jgi:hypothetical protein